jgi:flagellar basal body-associated protein FliL
MNSQKQNKMKAPTEQMNKSSQQVLIASALMVFFIVMGMIIGWNMKSEQIQKQRPHVIWGYTPNAK